MPPTNGRSDHDEELVELGVEASWQRARSDFLGCVLPDRTISFTFAIVGRPNVGKSTLFNRLVGRRLALVDDEPGVTRDRQEGEGKLGDLSFKVIDTAGLEHAAAGGLSARMQAQTAAAMAQADAVLFLVDARAGVTPARTALSPTWRANRASPQSWSPIKARAEPARLERWRRMRWDLASPFTISAEHGRV